MLNTYPSSQAGADDEDGDEVCSVLCSLDPSCNDDVPVDNYDYLPTQN
jgi:hypothetical protein